MKRFIFLAITLLFSQSALAQALCGIIPDGSTEVVTRHFLWKDAGATAGTEGDPLTGLTNSSSGLKICSILSGEATEECYTGGTDIETITTIGTHADPSASSVRFKEIDSTNMPGWYEVQWLDARWASGSFASVTIYGAADLASANCLYQMDTPTLAELGTYLTGTTGLPTLTQLQTDHDTLAQSADVTTITGDIADLADGTTPVWVQGQTIATGTCDSGTVSTCVDAALTESDAGYWSQGVAIVFTSGTISGQPRCITSFAPATDTITFRPPTTQAVSTNTYTLIAAPTCRNFP